MSKNYEILQQLSRSEPLKREAVDRGVRHAVPPLDDVTGSEIRKIVEQLFFSPDRRVCRFVTFVGVEDKTGCSWTCAQCGKMLAAQSGWSVCVLDANHEQPALSNHFESGIDSSEIKSDREDGFEMVWHKNIALTAPTQELIGDPEVYHSAIARLRSRFDYVLVDTPAANRSSEGITIGKIGDGVVFVVEANRTRRDVASKVKQDFETAGVTVLGAVLNNRTYPVPDFIYRRL